MARRQLISYEIIDSKDGKPLKEEDAQQVVLAIDGNVYELDLSVANAAKLRAIVAEYVGEEDSHSASTYFGGRPSVPTRTRRTTPSPRLSSEERATLTAWAAKELQQVVAPKGRIAASVVEAWEAAGRPSV